MKQPIPTKRVRNFASSFLCLAFGVGGLLGLPGSGFAQTNLVFDASFEAPTPSWFNEAGAATYFAGKEQVADAPDGKFVLAIQGWDRAGCKILSPPLRLTSEVYSASLQVRSFGAAQGAKLGLSLYDEKGEQQLASFGSVALDGKGSWSQLSAQDKPLWTPATKGRLALRVRGPHRGVRVEVDQVGLFAGSKLGPIVDNADFTWFEAETMADGKAWKVAKHYGGGWYVDLPSGMQMLAGNEAVDEKDNKPVTHTIRVRLPGPHRLWVRLVRTNAENHNTYTILLRQGGKTVASRRIDDGDPQLGPDLTWVWVPLEANLAAGSAEVVLHRPASVSAWVARKMDLFALTNLLDYVPDMQHFRSDGYVRFTNRGADQDPFCVWLFVHRHQLPVYYVVPGMLSTAGLSGSYYVPADRDKWLRPGEASPWVRISDFLLPGDGYNNIRLVATRNSHTEGLVKGRVRGKLEFAVGPERRLVRTLDIDQEGPQLLMTWPHDFAAAPEEILTANDYLRRSEAAIQKLPASEAPRARYLDLNVSLHLQKGLDDPRVIEREVALLRRLGFNGTYLLVCDPREASAFHRAQGLQQHFGLYDNLLLTKRDCQSQPDEAKIDAQIKALADRNAPILDRIERFKLADEPSGMPYNHLASCPICRKKFAADLKERGATPRFLGVADWDEVVPVQPADRHKHPELFYYTGLFRLRALAGLVRAAEASRRRYMPDNVKTYVNYSPPFSEELTWVQRGTDPFFIQRAGGLGMGWTEDWLGYGASPQQMSTILALLRAAGDERPALGAYMVAVSGHAAIQRLKYYTLLAGGARHLDVYNYGPLYAGIDSWSTHYDIYPVIAAVQRELATLDEPLRGTTRHPAETAILYNRTAAIWSDRDSTSEQDSRFTHAALAHAGYDAAFLAEEDVEAGKLDAYKVLYLHGPQIRRKTANKIADWVHKGGVLAGSAGAGSRDEFDRPLDVLTAVFGAESRGLKLEKDAGRPKYQLRTQPSLDVLKSVPDAELPQVSFDQLCFRESLAPAEDARVILRNKAGEPAGVLHSYGKGRAVRLAACAGIAYLHEAVRSKEYDVETYLPRDYRPELRDFLAWPAKLAKAAPVARASAPVCEVARYDGKGRCVLFVLNHKGTPIKDFVLRLPQAKGLLSARTASGKPARLRSLSEDVVEITFSLDVAEAIILTTGR